MSPVPPGARLATRRMLIRNEFLRGIAEGTISLAFRRWRRPTVRTGGALLTAVGQVHIATVATVAESSITEHDARRAGYSSLAELLQELDRRPEGEIYRIELGGITPDPRTQLREAVPDDAALESARQRLAQLDRRSPHGPWTRQVLQLLAEHPGVRAEDLAHRMGMEKLPFKANVRKLKALGLTISLASGYRLSARGERVLAALAQREP